MATTPRPYIWKEAELISDAADETGATFHFYDAYAEMIYPNSGLKYKYGEVPEGHWEELDLSDEGTLEEINYEFLKSDHPATGSLYMIGLRKTSSHDTLYLFRYDYMRDMSELVENIVLTMQGDNPIGQISASIKNTKDSLFTKESSIFVPSSRLIAGIAYGQSMINTLMTGYADEIAWKYGKSTVSITGRNTVGYLLNGQTFDEDVSFSGTAMDVLTSIFNRFGVKNFEIDDSDDKIIEFDVSASDTGMKALQIVSEIMTDIWNNLIWDTEELYDGRIVCGYAEFRGTKNPKGNYIFHGKNDVFSNSVNRSIDGSFSHVRCIGTNKNGEDLIPVTKSVTSWRFWTPGDHRTYHAPRVDGITQAELEQYAEIIAKQLKEGGQTIQYKSTLRPQLLIGDVAKIQSQNSEEPDKTLGIITDIRHTLGNKGFMTEFTASSGGEIQTAAGNKVYTKSRGVNGSNRSRRVSDFITTPTENERTALNSQPANTQGQLITRLWAQFDGSDYIRLPFKLNEKYRVFVDYELDQTAMAGSAVNMGIIGQADSTNYLCLVAVRAGYYETSSGRVSMGFTASTTGRHTFEVNKIMDVAGDLRNCILFDNENIYGWFLPQTLSTYGMMYLGNCAGASEKFVGKIYRYKIYDNDTDELLMNLVPTELVSSISGGQTLKTGLYDTVSKIFYNFDGMTVGGYG